MTRGLALLVALALVPSLALAKDARSAASQPLVVNNTMYLVTPYPNVSYAIDLTTEGQPLKWKFRPENAQAAAGQACCDVVNRGAAYADGKMFYNLLDGHTVAVDVATGRQLWRTRMADLTAAEPFTGMLREGAQALRRVVATAALHGIAVPALSAALATFDLRRTLRTTANLIQGQRDYFGAHGFERTDREGSGFHGPWSDQT